MARVLAPRSFPTVLLLIVTAACAAKPDAQTVTPGPAVAPPHDRTADSLSPPSPPASRQGSKSLAAGPRPLGFADLHNHQFSHLASGHMIWGEPSGPPSQALRHCSPAALGPQHGHGPIGVENALERYHPVRCGNYGGHHVGGSPQYDGWPRWDTFTHQQVYETWLERAYIGGLRLMVMMATNSPDLCKIPGVYDCKPDMVAVRDQFHAAKAFERRIDELATCGGPCASPPFQDACDVAVQDCDAVYHGDRPGWYRIVYTPEQARETIEKGKLAVVLGMEVPDAFSCKSGRCTRAILASAVEQYQRWGLRHMFPIHNQQNAFGGAAIFNDGQAEVGGLDVGPVRDCSGEGYLYQQAHRICGATTFAVRCSNQGLTALGRSLLSVLMDKHLIIDIDHMSVLARAEATKLARTRASRPYPLVSSHTDFFDKSEGAGKNEAALKQAELEGVRDLGGMIAPILDPGAFSGVCGPRYFSNGSPICGEPAVGTSCAPHDWASSAEWARAFLYASQLMRGPVAIGSDFNGVMLLPRPRFGAEGCKLPAAANLGFTSYPFALHPGLPPVAAPTCGGTVRCACLDAEGRMPECTFEQQTWNVNDDGLPHVGLLPDFLEDVRVQFEARYRQIGIDAIEATRLATEDLDPLFRSADAYVLMWERVEGKTPPRMEDGREPNDSLSTATAGQQVAMTEDLGLHDEEDVDYLYYDFAPACVRVVVSVSYLSTDVGPSVRVLDEKGNALASKRMDSLGLAELVLERHKGRFYVEVTHDVTSICRNLFDCRLELLEFEGTYHVAVSTTPPPNVGAEVCDGLDNDCNGRIDDCAPGTDPECVDLDQDDEMNCFDVDDDGDCVLDSYPDNCRTVANANASCHQADDHHRCHRCAMPDMSTHLQMLTNWLRICAARPRGAGCMGGACPLEDAVGAEGAAFVKTLQKLRMNGDSLVSSAEFAPARELLDDVLRGTRRRPARSLPSLPADLEMLACGWGNGIQGAAEAIAKAESLYAECKARERAFVLQGMCLKDSDGDGVGDACEAP